MSVRNRSKTVLVIDCLVIDWLSQLSEHSSTECSPKGHSRERSLYVCVCSLARLLWMGYIHPANSNNNENFPQRRAELAGLVWQALRLVEQAALCTGVCYFWVRLQLSRVLLLPLPLEFPFPLHILRHGIGTEVVWAWGLCCKENKSSALTHQRE